MKKLTNHLIKLLLVTLVLVITNCQKDETVHEHSEVSIDNVSENIFGITSRKVSINEIPKVESFLNSRVARQGRNETSGNYVVTSFGIIPLEEIIEVTDSLGNANYTFAIVPNQIINNRFYNLVVSVGAETEEPTSIVFEYAMDDTYASTLSNGLTTLGEFTGTINRYSTETFLNNFASTNRADCPDPNGEGFEPSCDPLDLDDGSPTDDGDIGQDGSDGTNDGSFGGGGTSGDGSNPGDGAPGDGGLGDGTGDDGGTDAELIWVCNAYGNEHLIPDDCCCKDQGGTWVIVEDNNSSNRSISRSSCGNGGSTAITIVPFEDMPTALGLDINQTIWLSQNCLIEQSLYQFLIFNSWSEEAKETMNIVVDVLMTNPEINDFTEALTFAGTYFGKKSDDENAETVYLDEVLPCFDTENNENAFHDVIIYVEQPVENTEIVNEGWNAGHTFIQITQANNGNVVSQVIGFYPNDDDVSPNNPSVVGGFYDDSGHEYDVSLTVEVNSNQFNDIINYLESFIPQEMGDTVEYNLNNFNCSDFALDIMNMTDVEIPDREATWGGEMGFDFGQGSCPAYLGQDIRNTDFGPNTPKDIDGGSAFTSTENDCQ